MFVYPIYGEACNSLSFLCFIRLANPIKLMREDRRERIARVLVLTCIYFEEYN